MNCTTFMVRFKNGVARRLTAEAYVEAVPVIVVVQPVMVAAVRTPYIYGGVLPVKYALAGAAYSANGVVPQVNKVLA